MSTRMKLGLGAAALGTAGVAALYISDRFNQVEEERQKDRAAADKERAATEKNRADAEKERERHAMEREQERANAAERERERAREREQERTAADERERERAREREQERAAAATRLQERDAADSTRQCELKSELERRFAELREKSQIQLPQTDFNSKWLRVQPEYNYATDNSNIVISINLVVNTRGFVPTKENYKSDNCTHKYVTSTPHTCSFHLPATEHSEGNQNCTPTTGIDDTWFKKQWTTKSWPIFIKLTFGDCRSSAFQCSGRLDRFAKMFNLKAVVEAVYASRESQDELLILLRKT